jgi:large subunit ribosomal protein L1
LFVAVVLPAGTGKTVRVAVFARATRLKKPKQLALTSLVWKTWLSVKAGDMPFDVVIASPDTMRIVGTLGQILGPRGLMPNPKVGTVTPDVATAVKNAKAGQVQYRTDKAGIIHATIGRKSFSDADLKSNLVALIDALNKAKPASSKGVYLRKVRCRPPWAQAYVLTRLPGSLSKVLVACALHAAQSLGWCAVRSGQAIKDRWAGCIR